MTERRAYRAVLVAVLALGLLITGCTKHDGAARQPSSSSALPPPPQLSLIQPATVPEDNGQLPSFAPNPEIGADCQYPASREPASKQVQRPPSGRVPTEPAAVAATMATDRGSIGLTLDYAKSPCTANSFASLAKQGYFDGTACHRLTTSPSLQVLQCGDPTGNGTGGPGYQFADEYPASLYPFGASARNPVAYPRGTLAMANAGSNTNGSQFFLVYADSQLPPAYTVFGRIDDAGLGVLDTVAQAGVQGGGQDGAPATPVTITSVRVA